MAEEVIGQFCNRKSLKLIPIKAKFMFFVVLCNNVTHMKTFQLVMCRFRITYGLRRVRKGSISKQGHCLLRIQLYTCTDACKSVKPKQLWSIEMQHGGWIRQPQWKLHSQKTDACWQQVNDNDTNSINKAFKWKTSEGNPNVSIS